MNLDQHTPVVAGLDIGSNKVVTVIGRKAGNGIEILGMGAAATDGMRRGAVVNVDATVQSIRESVSEAEKASGVAIESVYAGVSGPLVKSFNSHAAIPVKNEQEVTDADVARVLERAKAVDLPHDRETLHVLTQEFIVDDAGGIKDPRGMTGIRLDARVHVVTADIPSMKNLARCIEKSGLNVSDLVLSSLATSEAVLTPEEREVGVVLLDFGGGTVEMAIFRDGSLRHTAFLPYGGSMITSDLASVLKLPFQDAETLKVNSGCAMVQRVRRDELVELPGIGGRKPRPSRRQHIAEIIEARSEEIFTRLKKEIMRSGLDDQIGAGIVLTGGSALMEGLPELGERVFGVDVRPGLRSIGIEGMVEVVAGPSYATAVGLAMYGARIAEQSGPADGDEDDDGIIARFRRYIQELF
ncbi:MAG TPA: cell division protein FtsA [Candidatus Deferrimicrobiaceae bacterium]|jgi:cell division protein FtsA